MNNLQWSEKPTSSSTHTEKVIELLNTNFCSLIDTVKGFSATEQLVTERLLHVRDELIRIESELIKESVRSDIAVR